MCLILFAWQAHPRYPLVVAANRDEFHDRPTGAAEFWEESPDILAGRDLQAGGTWMGISRNGHFAAISNYREPQYKASELEYSRGHLVRDFLLDNSAPESYAENLQTWGKFYRGFNILVGDPDALFYVSNRKDGPVKVGPGCHGLSNHLLNTDWPKVHSGRERLQSVLQDEEVDPEALLELLADRTARSTTSLSTEELQSEPERMNKRTFIDSPVYGTRSSTVLLMDNSGDFIFVERAFNAEGTPGSTWEHRLKKRQ
jgi:uncharacterized protein with NRDE domain